MVKISELYPGRAVVLQNGVFGTVKRVDLSRGSTGRAKPKPVVLVHLPSTGADGYHQPKDLKILGAGRTKGTVGHWSRKNAQLTVFDKHQLQIARQTLKMSDSGARIMGGPSKAEARRIIFNLTGKQAKE